MRCVKRSRSANCNSQRRGEAIDVDNALAKAIRVLNDASVLWADASLEDDPA